MAMINHTKNETVLDKSLLVYLSDKNEENLDGLIHSATGLIYYFIKLYGAGRSENDLYQVGVEGLLKALKRYQPHLGASFTTFAAHCIVGEIRHYVRKETSYYKPGCISGLQFKIDKEIESVLKETGVPPTIKEIADSLNITEESIQEVMRAGLMNFDDIDKTKITSQRHESFKLSIEDQLTLSQAMKKLDAIQKKVIYMLFYWGMTQQETATALGFNQRKISRIKEKSLEVLKEEMS